MMMTLSVFLLEVSGFSRKIRARKITCFVARAIMEVVLIVLVRMNESIMFRR